METFVPEKTHVHAMGRQDVPKIKSVAAMVAVGSIPIINYAI